MKKILTLSFFLFSFSLFLVSCGDSIDEKVVTMQSEIDSLNERIAELEAKSMELDSIETTEDATDSKDPKEDSASKDEVEDTSSDSSGLSEYAFESCNTLSSYSQQSWYAEFKKAFEAVYPAKANDQYYPSFAKLTESCYSSVGSVVIALQPGSNMNAGFHLFKFDIKKGRLNEAYIQSGGLTTFVTPVDFGRRNGATINMFGNGTKDACSENNTFAYNYVENTLYLKESCQSCTGAEKKCTNY